MKIIMNKKTKDQKQKYTIKKEKRIYDHTALDNTIISLYVPFKLLNVIESKRNRIPRSVFIVDILAKQLGVKLDNDDDDE